MRQPSLFLFLLFLLSATNLIGQTQPETRPLEFGKVHSLYSKSLGEERILNVWTPQGYHPDSALSYPVVYVLDGSAHEDFPHLAGLVQFCNMYQLYPKSIVVGIANVDRYRDFTTLSEDTLDMQSIPNAGGADRFMDFLEKEVAPFVNQHYATDGHRTLIGQSLGGLMASLVLLKRPHLVDDYIIVSPSLWWNRQEFADKAAEILKKQETKTAHRIFLSIGKEHPVMHEVADKLAAAIRESGNEQLDFVYEPILDEDHATILHMAVYKAFKWLGEKPEE